MSEDEEPILIFTTKVAKCATGYHLKIRPRDVNYLKIAGKNVLVKVYVAEGKDQALEEVMMYRALETGAD